MSVTKAGGRLRQSETAESCSIISDEVQWCAGKTTFCDEKEVGHNNTMQHEVPFIDLW